MQKFEVDIYTEKIFIVKISAGWPCLKKKENIYHNN